MNRYSVLLQNFNIDQFSFEHCGNFKYFGANINYKNDLYNEINAKISAARVLRNGYNVFIKISF